MNNLNPTIFLLPVISLVLVSVLYINLLKKSINKQTFKHFIFIISTLSFLLNFTWELLQAPLYASMAIDKNHSILCALASVADVIMVLLMYFGLSIVYKTPFWVKNLSIKRIVITMILGGTGAILSEIEHIAAGSWTYAKSMPLLPIVNVGLLPVLQFTILPILILYLSFFLLKFWD